MRAMPIFWVRRVKFSGRYSTRKERTHKLSRKKTLIYFYSKDRILEEKDKNEIIYDEKELNEIEH